MHFRDAILLSPSPPQAHIASAGTVPEVSHQTWGYFPQCRGSKYSPTPSLPPHPPPPLPLPCFYFTMSFLLSQDFMNYSKYFKNMPSQSKLMEEGGIEFFAVSSPTNSTSVYLSSFNYPQYFILPSSLFRLYNSDCKRTTAWGPTLSSPSRGSPSTSCSLM